MIYYATAVQCDVPSISIAGRSSHKAPYTLWYLSTGRMPLCTLGSSSWDPPAPVRKKK